MFIAFSSWTSLSLLKQWTRRNEPCELFPVFAFQLTVGSNNNIIWRWANKVGFLVQALFSSSGSVDANQPTEQPSNHPKSKQNARQHELSCFLEFCPFNCLFCCSFHHHHLISFQTHDRIRLCNVKQQSLNCSVSFFLTVCCLYNSSKCFSVNSQTNRQTNWQTSWWWWWWLPGCKILFLSMCGLLFSCVRACLKPQSEMVSLHVHSKWYKTLSPHGSSFGTGESWQLAEKHPRF